MVEFIFYLSLQDTSSQAVASDSGPVASEEEQLKEIPRALQELSLDDSSSNACSSAACSEASCNTSAASKVRFAIDFCSLCSKFKKTGVSHGLF